jgi:Rps23 Pro-64 3,4-dihydroxylase Tpa1-like proline 4-hydroxylase
MSTQIQATAAAEATAAVPRISRKSPRIFVQIAAYRDPDCQHTVRDLFEKATYPERIFVGICWQTIDGEDDVCFQVPSPRPSQVRIHKVDAGSARGVCWARHLTQKLWQDEEFTLQIDSHMRFEPGWDQALLQMWLQCANDRALLTCYPPGFTPPDTLQRDWIFGMAAKEFDAHGIFLMTGKPGFRADSFPDRPIPGAFVGACMLFGPGSIIRDVPYDPHLYFFGEEISLAARLWTSGYDIYHPNRLVVYHDWDRSKRPTHFSDHRDWGRHNDLSFMRTKHLLGTECATNQDALREIDTYGLGKVRSLAEYQAFSGVDFATRTISDRAASGLYDPPAPKLCAPAIVPARHEPRKVYESPEAIVFDDFLPEDVYERIHAFCVKTDYEHINTKGEISRAWHVHDGFPLRSTLNEFYYAEGQEKPEGKYVYPTGTDMDAFVDSLLAVQPQVSHLVGSAGQQWGHLSATAWMYPHGTGLSMHDDGSGIYTGAYVFFLNPEWRLHWGGLLLLVEGEGNSLVYEHRKQGDEMDFYRRKWLHANPTDDLLMEHGFARCIFPKRNRIVFIANNAYHMVTRVNEAAGDNLRMSIAGFFNRKK